MNVQRRFLSVVTMLSLIVIVLATVHFLPATAQRLPALATWLPAAAPELALASMSTPEKEVHWALQRARNESSVHVLAESRNTLIPLAVPRNMGRGEEKHTLVVEGDLVQPKRWAVPNVPKARLHLSTGTSSDGIDLVMVGGDAYVGYGGRWQKATDPLGMAAPGGDYLGLLAAVVDVAEMEPVSTAAGTLQRYEFAIDGPTYAENVRQRTERALRGKLPAGTRLKASPIHESMSGTGELWVDADGLPRREIIDLTIPNATDEHHAKSRVDVVFSRYGEAVTEIKAPVADGTGGLLTDPDAHVPANADGQLLTDPGEQPSIGASVESDDGQRQLAPPGGSSLPSLPWFPSIPVLPFLALPIMFLSIGLVRYRRARKVYVAIALAVTTSMLSGPLLQAHESQSLRRGLSETTTFERALVELGLADAADVNIVEMAKTTQRLAGIVEIQAEPGGDPDMAHDCRSLYVEQGLAQEDDEDGDGLTNAEEWCLGTDYTRADTDGDSITDTLEVAGFDYAGSHWTLDPLTDDTNRDGMTDGGEWFPYAEATGDRSCPDGNDPRDFDCDNVPNAYDDDNDGDGVTDGNDISPYAVYPPRPSVNLTVTSKITTHATTYLDLQVRPDQEDHLRLGTTALNWPDDTEGQITDRDSSKDDLRLVPILEFSSSMSPTLSAEYGLISREVGGTHYNIWAPLQAVGDAGNITAFNARIAYTAEETQADIDIVDARIRWVTPAKLDSCKRGTSGDSCEVVTKTSIIASYVEEKFHITGLRVTATSDVQVGLFGTSAPETSLDPTVPDEAKTMFNLLSGLSPTFLSNENPTLAQIADSFADQSATEPFTDTWGVDPSTAFARYEEYGHRDEALAATTMTVTEEFLDANYLSGDSCSAGHASSITPTLVSGYEETHASINVSNPLVVPHNHHKDVISLKAIGFTIPLGSAAEEVMRRVQLTQYHCSKSGSDEGYRWQSLLIGDALREIYRRYPEQGKQDWAGLVDLLFTAFYVGRSNIISVNGHLLPNVGEEADPNDLAEFMLPAETTLPGYLRTTYHLDYLMSRMSTAGAAHSFSDWSKQFGQIVNYGHYAMVGAVLLFKVFKFLWRWKGPMWTYLKFIWKSAAADRAQAQWVDEACVDITAEEAGMDAPVTLKGFFYKFYNDLKGGNLAAEIKLAQEEEGVEAKLVMTEEKIASNVKWTRLGAMAVAVVVTVGVLIFIWTAYATSAADASGIEGDTLLSESIASTIIAVVQMIVTILLEVLEWVLSASGLGLVIEIIILIVTYLIMVAYTCDEGHCDWNPLNTYNHLTQMLASWILHVKLLAWVPKDGGIDTGNTVMKIVGASTLSEGSVVSNTYDVKIPLTATIRPTVGETSANYISGRSGRTSDITKSWAFPMMTRDEDHIPSYAYPYNVANTVIMTDTKHFAGFPTSSYCGPIENDKKACTNTVRISFEVSEAGRDQEFAAVSQVAAYLSYIKCWGLGIYGCSTDMEAYLGPAEAGAGDPQELQNAWQEAHLHLTMDSLPISAEELWTWGAPDLQGNKEPTWNLDKDGDSLTDADEAAAGTDPAKWDTDGDRLSDGAEHQAVTMWRTNPTIRDTDGDSLDDQMEIRLGTHAWSADTDQDGLTDAEEVCHLGADGKPAGGWSVRMDGIGERSGVDMWVCSDPTKSDYDLDGLVDAQERTAGSSPYAPNSAPSLMVGASPSVVHNRRSVTVLEPGDALESTVTLANTSSQSVVKPMTMTYPTSDIRDMTVTGVTTSPGYSPPPAETVSGGFMWDFGDHPLGPVEAMTATLAGTVSPDITESLVSSIRATVPYTDVISPTLSVVKILTSTHPVLIDVEDPSSTILAPTDGVAINGESFVVGGTAHDPTSWPTGVEVSADGSTWHEANGTEAWAWTWELPEDGVYTVRTRATDYVGHVETPTSGTKVIVDNTAPGASFEGIADGDVLTSIRLNRIRLKGSATDLLSGASEVSGLSVIQISIDDKPWRIVPNNDLADSSHPPTADWSLTWNVNGERYGDHTLAVRAVDALGQVGEPTVITVTVDTLAPGDILSNARPDVSASGPVTLLGHVDDEANVPPPARPLSLETGPVWASEVISGATVWLMPDGPTTSTLSATWLGDVDGDRRADLAVGTPDKAIDGAKSAGRVSILYGQAGGWPVPPDAVAIGESPSSFAGGSGSHLGEYIAAAGDVNGDGLSDLLFGDTVNDVVYLAFGSSKELGRDKSLQQFWDYTYRARGKVFMVNSGHVGEWINSAGDVNGDGYDDLLIGVTGLGTKSRVYLVLGGSTSGTLRAQEYWLDAQSGLSTSVVAAVFELDGGTALATGIGDVNDDQFADFAVMAPNEAVYVILGGSQFAGQMSPLPVSPADVAAGSVTSGPPDGLHLVALGDVTGDGLTDLAYSAGNIPRVVYGRTDGWSAGMAADVSFDSYRPAPNGFLAGVGDVNDDGLSDLLLGTQSGKTYLVHGRSDLASSRPVAAMLSNVANAASAPYAAGADANCDRSSDLLMVPRMWESAPPSTADASAGPDGGGAQADEVEARLAAQTSQRSLRPELSLGPAAAPRPMGELPTAWHGGPAVGQAIEGSAVTAEGAAPDTPLRLAATPVTRYVDDDYCATCANDGHTWGTDAFATIQDGLNAAEAGDSASRGDIVLIGPGVYHEHVVVHAGKDYVTLRGVDPDAVFLDADGGLAIEVFPPSDHSPDVTGIEGVWIERLTIRNASTGIEVNYGGKQGDAEVSDPQNIRVRHTVFVQNESGSTGIAVGNAVNRSSSNVDIRHNTLVANSSSVKLVHNIPAALTSQIFLRDNLFTSLPNASPVPGWYVDDNGNMAAVRLNDRNGFAGQTGTAGDWSSPPTGNSAKLMTLTGAAFQDVASEIFRIGAASGASSLASDGTDIGYYTYHEPVWVDPTYCAKCENDGRTWGVDAYVSVQAAIDSGAWKVNLDPGAYRERMHLVNGLAVYGSGAGLTVLAPPDDSDGVLVGAEGVRGAQVALVTLAGDGHDDGLRLDSGAAVTLKRSVVRDTVTAVAVDGSNGGATATLVNDTLSGNESGVAATSCGNVDASNTIMAYHTGTALAYEQCATTKLHTYDLYWRNGQDLDDGASDTPTPGEVYADPRFVDASHNDYRPLPDSPAVDAGDPRSPHPPGTGKHTDIGYVQSVDAAVYVSQDYCQTCLNDGLEWQVDAFDLVQDGVDNVPDASGVWTVGVAPGTYEENVTLKSGVRLVGSGADLSVIDGQEDESTVTIDGATHVELRGFTLQYAGFEDMDSGVKVTGASNNVTLTHNVLYANATNGLSFDGGSTGVVAFNTLVGNYETGLQLADLGTWVHARFNIFADNEVGIDDSSQGQVFNSYNLFWENGSDAEGSVELDDTTVYDDPSFVYPDEGPFWLEPGSAAAEAIPLIDYQPVPLGGGDLADLGYQELLAVPLSIMMGKEGERNCGMGASGVSELVAAVVKVDDATQTVEETAPPSPAASPGSWTTVTISDTSKVPGTNRNVPASYWSLQTTLADGDGLYRLYTVPTDVSGNSSSKPGQWYRSRFVADSASPSVTLMQPGGASVTAPAIQLAAVVTDTVETGSGVRDNVSRVYFDVGGAIVTATKKAGTTGRYESSAALVGGTHAIEAVAVDRAGNVGRSAAKSVTVSTPRNEAALVIPSPGSAVTQTTVNLVGYVHYTSSGGEGEVLLEVDGSAAGRADVEDTKAQFSRWTGQVTLAGDGTHTLKMTARRSTDPGGAHDTTTQLTLDTVAPSLTVQPQAGTAVFDVTFTGTATDATSGLAAVEVSTDGGYSWTAAEIDGGSWSLDWSVPLNTDYARFPLRVRATDAAGNASVKADTFVADNLGPTPFEMTILDPAQGSHLVAPAQVALAWTQPDDGSGTVTMLAAADQMTDTVPTGAPLPGNEFTAQMDQAGTWYVHVLAADDKGNQTLRHYGPWFAEGGGGVYSLAAREGRLASGLHGGQGADDELSQTAWDSSIRIDGHMHLGDEEWLPATERMDVDPRPRVPQELWASFDQASVHLGWRGANWGIDGAGYVYLDTGPGGATEPMSGTGATALPFDADALVVVRAGGGTLYRPAGGEWLAATEPGLSSVYGAHGHTEMVVPWSALGGGGGPLGLAAHAAKNGAALSVFPTNNSLGEAWDSAYRWDRVGRDTIPNEGQPKGHHARVAIASRESSASPLGPGRDVHYVLEVANLDHEALPGVTLVLTASDGLTLLDLDDGGAPAPGKVWPLELGDLAPGSTTTLSVTARLGDELSGIDTVTAVAELDAGMPAAESALARDSASHRVDTDGPQVVHRLPMSGGTLRSGAATVRGTAHDGDGVGVAYVEVRLGSGPWSRASGTAGWTAEVEVPASGTFELAARAIDSHGTVGAVRNATVTVDNSAPDASVTRMPMVATTRLLALSGTARDSHPDGGVIDRVEVQLDGGRWHRANGRISHAGDGTATWRTHMPLPASEGIPHRLRVRAVDAAGNVGEPSAAQTFMVDNRGPRSVIEEPQAGTEVVGDGRMLVWGQAHDGWGIAGVDVSADGGATWHEALLGADAARLMGNEWPSPGSGEAPGPNAIFLPTVSKHAVVNPGALWAIELAVPSGGLVLRSRATDLAGNVEPLRLPVRITYSAAGGAPQDLDLPGRSPEPVKFEIGDGEAVADGRLAPVR